MNFRPVLSFILLTALAGFWSATAALANERVIRYQLLEGSYLVDDCLVCGRPTILLPMRGSFDLVLLDQGPLFTRYEVREIHFEAGAGYWLHRVEGSGRYQIGGEVALQQQMDLQLKIDDGHTNKPCYFTNEHNPFDRTWPMMGITVAQTNGTLLQTYQLKICAAPLREIWFSTTAGFSAAKWASPTNKISGGDLLSANGRVVKRQHELTGRLGIMPIAPDVGLDALDIAPSGEVMFSIAQTIFSETLGTLQHGDLLSNQGKIVKRNQQLLAAFGLPATSADAGLDAVQILPDGTILFSISTNLARGTGRSLYRGDILSDRGEIFRSASQLLTRFHPVATNIDFGLDALYLWPNGEIWFSTEQNFQDTALGTVLAGDLLSDQGYRVFGNLDLLSAFAPLEDMADFGLDALFVVTDCRQSPTGPRLFGAQTAEGGLKFQWSGLGQVFQLERASSPFGPFAPCSPILPDSAFDEPAGVQSQGFYRVRQW